ncbi:unnamed protein product [marine sediment metagenome]|uniref:Uncharacterized protein n=1 Tax=marine sediment metagenome TaxID=412755 RepID=X1V9M5_9ZZZZ
MAEREQLLKGKGERKQLELKVYFALCDLSNYFKTRDDPLQYEVNRLWHGLDRLRGIPEFPKVKQEINPQ